MAERQQKRGSPGRNSPRLQYSSHSDNMDTTQTTADSGSFKMPTDQQQIGAAVGGSDLAGFHAHNHEVKPLARDEHVKTVDEIFAFINEGFSSNENAPKEPTSSTFSLGSWSQPNVPASTHDQSITHSPRFKSGNSVNFNRQESTKHSSPTKEIDEFLPEEKTMDFSLTTASWKGRTPPAQLVEIDQSNDIERSSHSVKGKQLVSRHGESRRSRNGPIEDIPETGEYVRNIDVKPNKSLKSTYTSTASRHRTVDKDLKKRLQVKLPETHLKAKPTEQTKKHRKNPSSSETFPSQHPTSGEHNKSTTKHHRQGKGKVKDTVNATEEFNIFGLVTQGNTSNTSSTSTSRHHVPDKIHITVDTPDPRVSLVQPNISKNRDQNMRGGGEPGKKEENIKVYVNVNVNMNKDEPATKPQRIHPNQQQTFNELDYSGYAEPMMFEHDLSEKSSSTLSGDGYENSELDSSTFSDRSLEIIPQSPTHINIPSSLHTSNDLSHLTLDRFRTTYNLGPGGLSPIPSESCESDRTCFQSEYSDQQRLPTDSENVSDSSATTIKGMIVDSETDEAGKARQMASTSTRGSGKPKPRKISFENDKPERYYGRYDATKRSRSYSQPEQYNLDKRQKAFHRMELGLQTEYHRRLGRTPSDPFSEQQNQNIPDFDHRFPLSFRRHRLSFGEDSIGLPSGLGDDDTDSITRQDFMRSSWNRRSPYSSRVSRTSSILSDSSRSGRRIRQLTVDIGEEWENIHPPTRPRTMSDVGSMSSGFSYRSLRKKRSNTELLVGAEAMSFGDVPHREPIEAVIKPGVLVTKDDTIPNDIHVTEEIESPMARMKDGARPISDVAGPVIIEVAEPEEGLGELSTKKRILLNNPYNNINQRFHSGLHCPCFLFFCFLCCAPAVYWMQRSDYEFDYASEKLAKRYGRRATVLYITGIILSILLFSAAITTTYFLLETELLQKGHLEV